MEPVDFMECGGLPPLCPMRIVTDPKAGASSRTPDYQRPSSVLGQGSQSHLQEVARCPQKFFCLCAANSGESCKSNKIFAAKERKEHKDKSLCCFSLRSLRSFAAMQCNFRELFIFGKILRTEFPNDKCQIFNDHFSIQIQHFGCGLPRWAFCAFSRLFSSSSPQSTPPTTQYAGLATKKRTQKLCNSITSCFVFQSQAANDSQANCEGVGGCKTPL